MDIFVWKCFLKKEVKKKDKQYLLKSCIHKIRDEKCHILYGYINEAMMMITTTI